MCFGNVNVLSWESSLEQECTHGSWGTRSLGSETRCRTLSPWAGPPAPHPTRGRAHCSPRAPGLSLSAPGTFATGGGHLTHGSCIRIFLVTNDVGHIPIGLLVPLFESPWSATFSMVCEPSHVLSLQMPSPLSALVVPWHRKKFLIYLKCDFFFFLCAESFLYRLKILHLTKIILLLF